ncbi:MAG: epoxyqueuosine reductase QueH [Chitinispirillaceae bacterium]|nr:epoxyqueuosine reductase QueH [Chitinispirillaceae bacterium]
MAVQKPKLLLHICCAPDEAWVVHTLSDRYKLFCFFCNPNIAPAKEYALRAEEAKRVAARFNVPFFSDAYEPHLWEAAIRGVAHTPEGGERCRRCFLLRLRLTARFCRELKWPFFTTVMSISPHKNAALLHECGTIAAQENEVAYEPFDFKKKDGFRNSVILSRELGLYRQDYCGCRLSKQERDRRNASASKDKYREKND